MSGSPKPATPDLKFKAGTFSSPQVTLIVGPEKKRLTAHSVILCKWSYFRAALLGNFIEAESQCIDFPLESPNTVEAFLEFCYSGDYSYHFTDYDMTGHVSGCNQQIFHSPGKIIKCSCELFSINSADTGDTGGTCNTCTHNLENHIGLSARLAELALAKMELHTRVYVLADKLGIPTLQTLAAGRVYPPTLPASNKSKIDIARYIYLNTPSTDKLLRKKALEVTMEILLKKQNPSLFWKIDETNRALEEIVVEDPTFSLDIIKEFMARNTKPN